jgi:hypothetical protein
LATFEVITEAQRVKGGGLLLRGEANPLQRGPF